MYMLLWRLSLKAQSLDIQSAKICWLHYHHIIFIVAKFYGVLNFDEPSLKKSVSNALRCILFLLLA